MSKNSTPWIQTVTLTPQSLKDNTADADRLISCLKPRLKTNAIDIDLSLLRGLPELLRENKFHVRCILFKDRQRWLLTGISGVDDSRPIAGLAVDLGTSRVVLRLLDLQTGQTTAETAFDNPQDAIGPDILTRIHFAEKEDALEKLNALIINGLNKAIVKLCRSHELEPHDIYVLSVAGNTTMTHLFMGLNPRWIIREPYIPVVNKPGILKAHKLGIEANPLARVLIFPNIGSYFGGDLIAGTFGAFIKPQSAISIGMLPDLPLDRYKPLGNSSSRFDTRVLTKDRP